MALKKFNAVSGFSVGDTVIRDVIDNAANVSANNLSVSAIADLGDIGNVKITGGSSGQVIKTDGTGNLVWGQDSASAAGSNTQVQFNNASSLAGSSNFTFDTATNTLSVTGYIARDNKNVPTYVTSATAPTDPKPGDIWYNSSNDTIYQYIYDGATFLWIDSSSGYISATVQATPDMIVLRDNHGNVYANNLNGSNLNVSGKSYLGNVGNLHITGGTTGQVLTTDGAGNLIWAAVSADTASFSNGTSYLTINHNSNIDMTINGQYNVLSVVEDGIVVTGNSILGDIATANFFSGSGAQLFDIDGANVTGYVANATNADFADVAYNVDGSNVNGTVASATVAAIANSVAGANVTGTVASATVAATANSVAGANVTGTVSSATVAASANSVAGANVTGYVANATHSNVADVANSVSGSNVTGYVQNANIANIAYSVSGANVIGIVPNAAFATSAETIAGANVTGYVANANHANVADVANSVSGSNVSGTVSSATVAASANSVAGANVTGYVANATHSNVADVANTIAGANVTGYVANATHSNVADVANTIAGANVTGIVANATFASNAANANVANTVLVSAQPNITSVGTLTSLSVSGTATINGNLVVTGSTITANATTINVKDPLIELGGNTTGASLITNDGKDRGTILHYFTTSAVDAFMGWDNSNAEFAFGSNVTVSDDVVTFNALGNLRVHTLFGNLTGTATTTVTVLASNQPNITSLGNLTSLTVVGNITAGNVNGGNLVYANYFQGNGALLTSVTGANVTGYVANATHSNIADVANSVSGSNVSGYVANATHADAATIADTANAVAGANVSGYVPNATHSTIADTANAVAGANVTGYVPNATHSNVADLANAVAGANVTGYVPNATHATVANTANSVAGANVTGYVGNATYADYAGGAYSVSGANVNGAVDYATVANSVAVANVVGIGNIATINKDGNASNILYGNGVFAAAPTPGVSYGNSNVATYLASFGSNSITTTGNVTAGNIKTDSILYANGTPYVFTVSPGGSDTQIQFNQSNVFAGSGNLTFNTSTKTLTTDFIAADGYKLSNIAGSNVTGQVGNSLIAGTVYTAAQPNITSTGTLTGLTVAGNINLGSIGNLHINGGLPGYALTTDGAGNLSWAAASSGGTSGASFVSVVVDDFIGDGTTSSFTLSTTPASKQAVVINIGGLIQLASTYTLSGSTITFSGPPANGELIEITTYGIAGTAGSAAGNSGEVQYNNNGELGSSNAFTFNTTTNSMSVTGNLAASGGYLTLGSSVIAVSSGSAGVFTTGVSNVNLGLLANVTMGSSSGNVTARGNFIANAITSNTSVTASELGVHDIRSTRTPITVTSGTVIDSFAVNKYKTAKYTIRVGSDDGFQSIEVLLIHNGTVCFITVYGNISTSGSDIVLITSGINGGNVELYATTTSTNTSVNLIGTYVA